MSDHGFRTGVIHYFVFSLAHAWLNFFTMQKYSLVHKPKLGDGTYGRVVLAQNKVNGERVAIKMYVDTFSHYYLSFLAIYYFYLVRNM